MRSTPRLRGLAAALTLIIGITGLPGVAAAHAAPGMAGDALPESTGEVMVGHAGGVSEWHAGAVSGGPVAPADRASAVQDAPHGPPAPTAEDVAAAARLRIDLITMGPGDAVWERFGHNALRVHDPVTGEDVTYNYGMFDFAAEDFFPRFLRGDMLYWMEGFDTRAVVYSYIRMNRSVYAQELNLTAEQKARLVTFLEWNAREANRYYAYHYYRDNCSTRVRDAIDYALGGQLQAALGDVATEATYRSHTRRLTADDLPIYTGLNLAMSAAIDRPLTAWEESFLPLELLRHVRDVQVAGESGETMPLVLSELVIFEADRATTPELAPDRVPGYLAVGVLLGALLLALGRLAARGARVGRIGLVAVGGVWALVVGVLGTVITLLWAFTNHDVTYGNENLLQVNPLPLALVVLIPLAMLRGRAVRAASTVAWTLAGASAAGLLLQALPGLDQVNGEIIALALPVHFGLAGALWLVRSRAAAPEAAAADRAAPVEV